MTIFESSLRQCRHHVSGAHLHELIQSQYMWYLLINNLELGSDTGHLSSAQNGLGNFHFVRKAQGNAGNG